MSRAPILQSHVISSGVVCHFGRHLLVIELCARTVDSDCTLQEASVRIVVTTKSVGNWCLSPVTVGGHLFRQSWRL